MPHLIYGCITLTRLVKPSFDKLLVKQVHDSHTSRSSSPIEILLPLWRVLKASKGKNDIIISAVHITITTR